jgi:hypothetical protein
MTQTERDLYVKTNANIVAQPVTLLKYAGGYLNKILLRTLKSHKH